MSMILPTNQNATDDEREKLKKKKKKKNNKWIDKSHLSTNLESKEMPIEK